MLKTKISPSVVFIPEEDPPVFFPLPTFLTRVKRPTLKESLGREISGSSEAQPTILECKVQEESPNRATTVLAEKNDRSSGVLEIPYDEEGEGPPDLSN